MTFASKRIFWLLCFCAPIVCLSAPISVWTQDIPNYIFLEVVDSAQKPVEKAFVEITPPEKVRKNQYKIGLQSKTTDYLGRVDFWLPHVGFEISQSLFRVSKPGFFDFSDFGQTYRYRDRAEFFVELLKIPENPAEKKALGDEQLKREFLWAARDGNSSKVRFFLKKGLDPSLATGDLRGVKMRQNLAAIVLAAGSGDGETVRALLRAGANVRSDEEPMRSVVAHFLTINPATRREYKTGKERAVAVAVFLRALKMLVESGAATNDILGLKGLNALMVAARENDSESAESLIKLGIPVNQNVGGYSALINALDQYGSNTAGYSTRKVVEVLLKAGADPNITVNTDNDNCRSPLMQAVYGGDVETVSLLLAYKAEVNFTCKNGANAIKWAKRYVHAGEENQKKIIALLETHGAK